MANKFDTWLKTAPAGAQFVYRTGKHLSKGGNGLEFSDLVYSVREAFDRGEVELVQKRLTHGKSAVSIGSFAWIAIKKAHIRPPKRWVSKDGSVVCWKTRPEKITIG